MKFPNGQLEEQSEICSMYKLTLGMIGMNDFMSSNVSDLLTMCQLVFRISFDHEQKE